MGKAERWNMKLEKGLEIKQENGSLKAIRESFWARQSETVVYWTKSRFPGAMDMPSRSSHG